MPSGQYTPTPTSNPNCPAGKNCPYKWHMRGDGVEVDSTVATGAGIMAGMGIDWGDFLSDDYSPASRAWSPSPTPMT